MESHIFVDFLSRTFKTGPAKAALLLYRNLYVLPYGSMRVVIICMQCQS